MHPITNPISPLKPPFQLKCLPKEPDRVTGVAPVANRPVLPMQVARSISTPPCNPPNPMKFQAINTSKIRRKATTTHITKASTTTITINRPRDRVGATAMTIIVTLSTHPLLRKGTNPDRRAIRKAHHVHRRGRRSLQSK